MTAYDEFDVKRRNCGDCTVISDLALAFMPLVGPTKDDN
jgi:hypothetical protein